MFLIPFVLIKSYGCFACSVMQDSIWSPFQLNWLFWLYGKRLFKFAALGWVPPPRMTNLEAVQPATPDLLRGVWFYHPVLKKTLILEGLHVFPCGLKNHFLMLLIVLRSYPNISVIWTVSPCLNFDFSIFSESPLTELEF